MPIPLILSLLQGASAGKSLYDSLTRKKPIPPFLGPLSQDPDLSFANQQIGANQRSDQAQTMDEISRSGLLGSSVASGMTNAVQDRAAQARENARNQIIAKRRAEQLGLYTDELNFQHQNDLQEHLLGLNSLGDSASGLGTLLKPNNTSESSFPGIDSNWSYEDFLRRLMQHHTSLPIGDLLNASQLPWEPITQRR